MLNPQRLKTILHLKGLTRILIPNLNPNFPNILSTNSHNYSKITSNQNSFTVSYLINNCGFSPESALIASKQVHFETAQKPDSVITFFRNHGFNKSQLFSIIRKAPNVLTSDPHKRVLSKFEFLYSNGASSSDIVLLVNRDPRFLYSSLENSIIPRYEFVKRFLKCDKKTIKCIVVCPGLLGRFLMEKNVNFLLDDVGVAESHICCLLQSRPSILLSDFNHLKEAVNEVKAMGFDDPSKVTFVIALLARRAMSKSRWDAKVEVFKSWGWSEENVLEAFRKEPKCMLSSKDKINEVMRLWVSQLGWNSLALVDGPGMFGYSLEKRIIPRAFVVQYLLAKGLRKKNASLFSPFVISDKLFIEKYVESFKEERSELLKLYQEKLNVQDSKRMV
ncbi:PREDICTED: uncharacterized protein LOC109327259 isoform X2 [Lupinus angustifolius]|uniref:uncharacterized protein LOC109327259 isoform X1 n=1 Tax=Lupinus angustifolius TaxID=3871 RepID=UPI00092F48AA|nr:PREDICTED: uncharacterized protein LOC109327259 isoform X1 [Lupinus angustifolius]XP_019415869.1 PREDICTED: uncharacterized protein LOC109327259 isoform X2 [Lupinus angustifolius]